MCSYIFNDYRLKLEEYLPMDISVIQGQIVDKYSIYLSCLVEAIESHSDLEFAAVPHKRLLLDVWTSHFINPPKKRKNCDFCVIFQA